MLHGHKFLNCGDIIDFTRMNGSMSGLLTPHWTAQD